MGTRKKYRNWKRWFADKHILSCNGSSNSYSIWDKKEYSKTPSSFIFSNCTRQTKQSITCVNGGGTEGKSRAANKHVWVLSTTSCGIWDKEKHYGWPGALETPASLLLSPSGTSTHRLSATSHMIKTYLRTLQNSSKMANSIGLHWSRSEKKSKAFPRGKGTTTPTASAKVKGSEVSIICTYPHGDRPS